MIAVRLLLEGAVVREAVFPLDHPIVLGRGPEAHFVLTDPSVSRVHARIFRDESGAAVIEDAGGRNGLLVESLGVERATIPPGQPLRCRLGAVEIEVTRPSADATLEWRRPEHGAKRGLRAAVYWAAGVGAILASGLVRPSFWSPWDQNRLTSAAWTGIAAAVVLPVLAFLLVGLLRIGGRRVRLSETLRALAVVAGGWTVLALVEIALPYVTAVGAHETTEALLRLGGASATVAYLASVSRPGPRHRFLLAWGGASGLLALAFYLVGSLAARQAGTPDPRYEVSVPLRGFAGPVSDLESYLERVRVRFASAQREAEEERVRAESTR
jgi:hypothetical protein